MTREDKLQLIENLAPFAVATMNRTGIPASITLAQATIESADSRGNWGASPLVAEANNWFGIKARRRRGVLIDPYREFKTREWNREAKKYDSVRAPFRRFDSIQECFDCHADLISSADRYQPAMKIATDPSFQAKPELLRQKFALQLQLCGYSTNPSYPAMLIERIDNWNMARFDEERGK